jgi:hypothetical protein
VQNESLFYSPTNPLWVVLAYMHMRGAFKVGSVLTAIKEHDYSFTDEAKKQQMIVCVHQTSGRVVSA